MLCRSIAKKGLNNIKTLIEGSEMAEIRIEKSGLNTSEIKLLFQSHHNLLATCRPDGLDDPQRTELLTAAIEGGAKWIDIEVESDKIFTTHLVNLAKSSGCKVIISYHNYENTPASDDLYNIVNQCAKLGADLVKLATLVNTANDSARLLSLYALNIPILSIGMGKTGSITRLAALKLGAPFTFVSCDSEFETAPGQLKENEMKDILKYL